MSTPQFTISNGRPADLKTTDFEPPMEGSHDYDLFTVSQKFLTSVFLQPISNNTPISVIDNDGKNYSRDEMAILCADALLDPANTNANTIANALAQKLTLHSRTEHNLPFDQLLLSQALGVSGLPSTMGKQIVRYDVGTDLIDPALQYIQYVNNPGKRNYDRACEYLNTFYAGLASLYTPRGHAIAFANADAFNQFKQQILTTIIALNNSGKAHAGALDKAKQLQKIKLDDEIVTGIRLRGKDQAFSEDYSFARVTHAAARKFTIAAHNNANNADEAPISEMMPFGLNSLINPENILFINMENHARSPQSDIIKAWLDIVKSTHTSINMVSLKKLTKVNAVTANVNRMTAKIAVSANQRVSDDLQRRQASESNFKGKPATPKDAAIDIIKKLRSMANTNKSQNIHLMKKKTYNRPSRRQRPTSFGNAPGRIKKKTYYPDIHFYADTSGSMSLEDYQDTLILITMIARKLKCNVYFSSFSHVLSSEVLLPTKNQTAAQIQQIIKGIPKVSGGTDFTQIWDNINRLDENKRRLNIISTDFGYTARPYPKIDHPKNIVYVPAFNRKDPHAWDGRYGIKSMAADFINSMRPHDPHIDKKILGMDYKPSPLTNTPAP